MFAFARNLAVATLIAVTFGLSAVASATEVTLSSTPVSFTVPDEDRVAYFTQPDPERCVLMIHLYRVDAAGGVAELLGEVITPVANDNQPFALNPSNNMLGDHIIVTCDGGQLTAEGDYPIFR